MVPDVHGVVKHLWDVWRGGGGGGVFNLSMQVIWMFSGIKYALLLYCCDDLQTKVYSSATIKNCTCAHIGTPRCWLLLDDLK